MIGFIFMIEEFKSIKKLHDYNFNRSIYVKEKEPKIKLEKRLYIDLFTLVFIFFFFM